MPEYSDLDNYQIVPSASTVTRIDTSDRSSASVILKAASGNASTIYVGRSTNKAGSALSATTGFPLAAGESVALDLVMGENRSDAAYPACFTTGSSQTLCVLALHP